MKYPRLLRSSLVACIVIVTGCASSGPKTFGDSIAADRDRYGALTEQWSEGQEAVEKGRKRIRKGRNQVRDGEDNISSGEAMITRGEQLMKEAERTYNAELRRAGEPPLGEE